MLGPLPLLLMKTPLFLLLFCAGSLAGAAAEPHPLNARIERLDPAFNRLVAPEAKIEKLAEGFRWAEGPVWYDGGIVFSDVLANTAYRWEPGMTEAKVFIQPSGLLSQT